MYIATGFSQAVVLIDSKVVKGAYYFDSELVRSRNEHGVETLEPRDGAIVLGATYEEAEIAAFEFARDNNY